MDEAKILCHTRWDCKYDVVANSRKSILKETTRSAG